MTADLLKKRISWVDYAKGICIIAVVSLYTTQYLQHAAGEVGWMQYWVDFARPFRMPDFFLIAGLFLSRTINAPWRAYLDKKVVHFIYFFVLWTTIYFVLHAVANRSLGEGGRATEYLGWYVEPFHMLWFIQMLPIFFIVTRLVRNIPWYFVLPAAALLQMLSVYPELGQINRFGARYVYFYAGFAFAPLIFRLAECAAQNVRVSLFWLICWAGVNEAFVLAKLSEKPGIGLMLGFAGAAAVVVAGSLLSRAKGTRWLAYLGQNTIIIFLSFFVFLSILAKVYDRFPIIPDLGTRQFLAMIIGILCPILGFRLVRNTPLQFLFRRPRWATLSIKNAMIVPAFSPKRDKTIAAPSTAQEDGPAADLLKPHHGNRPI